MYPNFQQIEILHFEIKRRKPRLSSMLKKEKVSKVKFRPLNLQMPKPDLLKRAHTCTII